MTSRIHYFGNVTTFEVQILKIGILSHINMINIPQVHQKTQIMGHYFNGSDSEALHTVHSVCSQDR